MVAGKMNTEKMQGNPEGKPDGVQTHDTWEKICFSARYSQFKPNIQRIGFKTTMLMLHF